jgi:hypothetical protein
MPGTYNVSIMAHGKTLDTKQLRIAMDPEVRMSAVERKKYNDVVMDLHELQRRGTVTATALTALNPQMVDAAAKVKDNAAIPADVKARFDALNTEFASMRAKFGVAANAGIRPAPGTAPGGGGGFGGGGGGGAAAAANVFGRTTALKNAIANIWETPSAALMNQYADVKKALPAAIVEADAFMKRAESVASALKAYGVVITVPPAAR